MCNSSITYRGEGILATIVKFAVVFFHSTHFAVPSLVIMYIFSYA